MPIVGKKIPISLTAATPTTLTPMKLKCQLDAIGLTCAQSDLALLPGYINDVKGSLPNYPDSSEVWSILKPTTDVAEPAEGVEELLMFASQCDLRHSSVGNWKPEDGALGYSTDLEYVQYKTHFDWLKANRPSFTGRAVNPAQYSGTNLTVTAIKDQFKKVGIVASSSVTKGLNRDAMESALSNAISPVTDQNVQDYDKSNSRVFFLVDNYNPKSGEADGIGVLTIEWHLKITEYKKKKGPVPLRHNYTLTVHARAVQYDSTDALTADEAAAQSHFNTYSFSQIIPKNTEVKIFPDRPPANRDSFNHGVPILADTNQAKVLVMYAPDLVNIASVDNTTSTVTTGYSKQVSRGFTFSTTQSVSIKASAEISIEVIKAGVEIGFALSFTEQWSKIETETMTFSVPSGKMAYLYQGTLLTAVLVFDARTGSYDFADEAKVLSPIMVTTAKPLLGETTIKS